MNTKEWSAVTKRKSFISPAPKSFSNPIDQANYNLGLVGTIFFVVTNKPLSNSREYFLYGNDRKDKNVITLEWNVAIRVIHPNII